MNEVKLAPISNREDYSESWQAFDEDGVAIDLTGATIVYELRHPDNGSVTSATVSISTTTFTATLTDDQTRALDMKEYDIGCTIEIDGFVSQFFVGTLPVVDGVVS